MSVESYNSFSISTSLNKVIKNTAKIENQDCIVYWDSSSTYRRVYRDEDNWSEEGSGGNVQFSTGDTITHFGPIKFFNDATNFNYKYAVNANMVDTTLKVYATNCDGTNLDESFIQSFTNAIESGDSAYRVYPMTNCISLIRKTENNNFDIRFYPYSGSNWNVTVLNTSSVTGSDYYFYDDVIINKNSKYLCNNNALYITGTNSSLLKTIILTPDINDGILTVSDTNISTAIDAEEIYGMKYYTNHGFVAKRNTNKVYITQISNLYDSSPTVSDYQLTTVTDGSFGSNPQILFHYRGGKYLFNSPDNGLVGKIQVANDAGSNFVTNETLNTFTNESTTVLDITVTDQPDAPVFFGTNGNTSLNTMLYGSEFGPMTDIETLTTDSVSIGSISFKTDKNEFFTQSFLIDNKVSFSKYRMNTIPPVKAGQQAFTTLGENTFTVPEYVFSIHAVAVGGGGGAGPYDGPNGPGGSGGAGGALAYKNNWLITPNDSITITVGSGGDAGSNGGDSTISYGGNILTASGGEGGRTITTGAPSTTGGIPSGYYDGGGNGGRGGNGGNADGDDGDPGGGGGAGGYSGNGGNGGNGASSSNPGSDGQGGGGGGGGCGNGSYEHSAGGGGVSLLGEGSSGLGGAAAPSGQPNPGGGGSGGNNGISGGTGIAFSGGTYGGGGGAKGGEQIGFPPSSGKGGQGAVRIIWGGSNRAYPNSNTGDL